MTSRTTACCSFTGSLTFNVDTATTHLTSLSLDNVNITDRLKPYITANGIEMPAAMVPAGTYVLQVAVSDASGRQSIANVEIDAK